LITEPAGQLDYVKGKNIANFHIVAGMVNTSYGPVFFIVFYFPDPRTSSKISYETLIDPFNLQQVSIYQRLASQLYWHVAIADDTGKVANFFEFPNQYNLDETIQQVLSACANFEPVNFDMAKAEFMANYSIDDLLNAR
ncbi:hypothetical protein, partial [Endozoicomonas sp. ONNA1]|uniref:hypothetical protein n=1 Tax=Endozoicomonas sp. ONNA1 TaxID=2828740 RepID=UPI0021499809